MGPKNEALRAVLRPGKIFYDLEVMEIEAKFAS